MVTGEWVMSPGEWLFVRGESLLADDLCLLSVGLG